MKNKEEGKHKMLVSTLVIVGMLIICAIPLNVTGAGDLPFYDIEQDSLGNYHKAFIDNSTGNYEIYYTNDIGGSYPQDWNPPTRITYTDTESILIDLGIYLPTDTMFIIWGEGLDPFEFGYPNSTGPTYYTISRDYGASWWGPNRSYENIMLKYAEFDPLVELPDVPTLPDNFADPYAYYIVQLKTPMIQEWHDGIENSGGIFCGYIAKNAYIIWMTPTKKNLVEQLPYIRWIGLYHPIYKIQSSLFSKTGIVNLTMAVIEETGGLRNLDKVINEIIALGGIILFDGAGSFIIKAQIDVVKVENISFIPEVEWIDEITEWEWGMNIVREYTGTNTVHGGIEGYEGEGIIGGLFDNGFDQSHPDFQGQIEDTDPDAIPEMAHGTCGFGILFANGNNDARGMLPSATGVFTDGEFYQFNQYNALTNLHNMGGVFQSSTGGYVGKGEYESQAIEIDEAIFDLDITRCTLMGNLGSGYMAQEATAKNGISVGGIDHKDTETLSDDEHWIHASAGPTQDGRIKPDLSGPADQNIYTTDSTVYTSDTEENGYDHDSNYFDSFGGTSGATSVVAGSAGLVYQMYRDNHFGNNPSGLDPHASTVKALLIANAHQYELSQATRYEQGWGSVDIGRVYEVGDKHLIINEDSPLEMHHWAAWEIYVQTDEPLKISLVWTDPPGTASVDPALVNDLFLIVYPPSFLSGQSNTYYCGNYGLDNALWSPEGWLRDHINNVENVFIETPEEGKWVIKVIAQEINEDGNIATPELDQPFALVASYKPAIPVQLYQGWNLISLPLEQEDPRIEVVLSSVLPYVHAVQYYDASDPSDPWKHWTGGGLQELHHYMGFYIDICGISEITLIVKGIPFTEHFGSMGYVPVTLYMGADQWNMVGYPSNKEGLTRNEALNNLQWGTHIDQILIHDTSLGFLRPLGEYEEFELGRGYYFHMIELPPSHEWEVEIDT